MSKIMPLELADGSGGLNNREPITAIKKNQFSKLVNYLTDEGAYLHKRGGQELIQYAPIDPQLFVADANTFGLWHLDEAASPYIDSSATARNITGTATRVAGLFPVGAPLGQRLTGPDQALGGTDGDLLISSFFPAGPQRLHGRTQITMEMWINIPDSFTGRPLDYERSTFGSATGIGTFSQSGAILMGTLSNDLEDNPNGYNVEFVKIQNGLQIFRDWDLTNNKDASDPYVTFTINTAGVAGTRTTLTSKSLATNKWLHIRGTYDATTGAMRLYVNGTQHRFSTVNGNGAIDDLTNNQNIYFASLQPSVTPWPSSTPTRCFPGVIDEIMLSSVVRTTFPFKKPRGNEMILEKADGTRQCVVAADDGLYYTVGDGGWTLITNTDPAPGVGALSSVAMWDGAMIEDRLYMTNGVNTPLTWDGLRVVPTGEGVTPLVLSLAASGSGNSNGSHNYVYAYKYGDDITGFSPVANIVVAGNADVNIGNIPTRHENCDTIQIYKTKAGGTRYFLDREIANDSTVDFINLSGPYVSGGSPDGDSGADGVADGSTDTNLNDDADYHEVDPIVQSASIKKNKFYLPEHNRLFGCGSPDFPYDLSWSALGNPDVFLATAFVPVSGDKGPLVGMATSHGEIIMSKNANATSVLRGTDESNWTLTENIHPKVGARDHWSFVHRYPVAGNGDYILCFVGSDGIYAHLGNQVVKLSDDINPTFESLAVNTSSKEDWVTTTQPEFQSAASNGGASTQNVQESRYEQDGLREFAGDVRIVDQLNYIGLWPGNDVLVPGKVLFIAQVKVAGVVIDGSYLFSTDANRNLYLTTDNFVTASAVTNLDAVVGTPILVTDDHRIIEITYANTGGLDQYFIATSNPSEAGYWAVFVFVQSNPPASIWGNSATALAGPYFWQGDTPWSLSIPGFGDIFADVPGQGAFARITFHGNIQVREAKNSTGGAIQSAQFSLPRNFYINHAQNVLLNENFPGDPHFAALWNEGSVLSNAGAFYFSAIQDNAVPFSAYNQAYGGPGVVSSGGFVTSATALAASVGFHGIANVVERSGSTLRNPSFNPSFTSRETALWKGGTFRPQSFWDSVGVASVPQLYFVASTGEDANGNRTSTVYRMPITGTPVAMFTALQSCIALASDGTNAYFSVQAKNGNGFTTTVKTFPLASGTISNYLVLTPNYLPYRLCWNANSLKLVTSGKFYSQGASLDSWTYNGFLGNVAAAGLIVIKSSVENGASGAFPIEMAYQTNTPYSIFAATINQQTGDETAIYKIGPNSGAADVSSYALDPYQGPDATNPTDAIRSNLLFAVSSGSAGSYLWSDRLYWYAHSALDVDGRMIQLGIPGTWTVKGGLTSRTNELGDFSAFGNLTVQYSGNVEFYMRNAATVLALAASEKQVTANQAIQGFSPLGAFAQWRLVLNWIYSVAAPTTTPIVSVVDVGFFVGVTSVPPVVAEHWNGRTYFSMALAGETDNNILIVYDKKNAFTTYLGWRIKGMRKFRNFLTALQDYELVRLESGTTDLGNLIEALAHTGALADGAIVALDDAEANVRSTVNPQFPGKSGFVKMTAYAGGDAGQFPRMFAIPEDPLADVQRVHAEPLDDFGWDWAQVYSLEIKTSDETSGSFVPSPNQQEVIQKIDLKLLPRPVSREYIGK